MKLLTFCVCVLVSLASIAYAAPFNGAGDFQLDAGGYYYAMTGGKFPTGTTPNGDNASGGTFRFLTDDPVWGYTIDTWRKDDWFPQNASLALTLKNGGAIVYDNNGIEDGTYGDYYDATAQGLASTACPGLYRGYSMSNNYDWIYAGYFKIEQTTTIDTLIGYFDANAGFNPASPMWKYRMNIWSNVAGDLLPVNTGGFDGDVLCSDTVAGTFAWSDTGVDRVFGADYGGITDDILRMTFALDAPVTLDPGVYWFSHDATVAVPEQPAALLAATPMLGAACMAIRRRLSSR